MSSQLKRHRRDGRVFSQSSIDHLISLFSLQNARFSHRSGPSIPIYSSTMRKHNPRHLKESGEQLRDHVTIDILPDDVLFEIFHCCRLGGMRKFDVTWEWEKLVHVCRRWRHLAFASPRHLDLRLVCTPRTRTREMLDIWPPIPIIINYSHNPRPKRSISNVLAALKHHDRIREIRLGDLTSSQLERVRVA
ncbi:hypothetical protein BJV74DRAFT_395509 [Russula compacta]|nr:hypothetical protein BJV74DRAFT_395509 [Russula compacta]